MEILKKLFSSKKFVAAFSAVVLAVLNDIFSLGVDPATTQEIIGVVIAYVLGQGIADHGKEAKKEEIPTQFD